MPWNKGKKGVQKGWNKGLTKENCDSLARVSKHTSETRSRLFKEGILVNSRKGTHLSEEHKRKHSEIMKLKHKEWKEKDPEKYKLRQSNASKHSQKGYATYQKHPELYQEFGRKLKDYMLKHPEETKMWQSRGGKTSIVKLNQWKHDNSEIVEEMSKKNGKMVGTKYAYQFAERVKNKHRELKDKDPEAYRQKQINAGKLSTGWKTTISRHPNHYSNMGKITHSRHPNQAREMVLKSIEKQTQRGFVSEPEKIMKKWLPPDFIHGKRLGNVGVPDFHSPQRKIVIEVDGCYWHSMKQNKNRDVAKDAYYRKMGYKVYRFTIYRNILKQENQIKSKLEQIFGE